MAEQIDIKPVLFYRKPWKLARFDV